MLWTWANRISIKYWNLKSEGLLYRANIKNLKNKFYGTKKMIFLSPFCYNLKSRKISIKIRLCYFFLFIKHKYSVRFHNKLIKNSLEKTTFNRWTELKTDAISQDQLVKWGSDRSDSKDGLWLKMLTTWKNHKTWETEKKIGTKNLTGFDLV